MVFCVHKFEGALQQDRKIFTSRSMQNLNRDAFLADVAEICWEQGLNETDDVDILVTCWSYLFSSVIDKHAPINSIRVSRRYYPWINANLKTVNA